jgi:SAM-dependent methyltransferase
VSGGDHRNQPRPNRANKIGSDRGRSDRKLQGAWYTPDHLVAVVVDAVADSLRSSAPRRQLRLVDPACGDGRFLVAAVERLRGEDVELEVVGVDIDPEAADATRQALAAMGADHRVVCADALTVDWSALGRFDVVIGNPPFLSQMAAATTRGGASGRGGGPYADAAVEFVALAAEIVAPDGGRVAFVLPQSLLSARDAADVRAHYDARATLRWSWWTGERVFDAQVLTCAVLFEFGVPSTSPGEWARVITDRRGVPDVPEDLHTDGTLGGRCRLNANFRDEYYGMVPAVDDHPSGPKLITSGLIDPGRCWWGERSITFAKQRFNRPRLDIAKLDAKMSRWASDRLVPKVLIANQTKILEAVADADGSMLPGVPVVAAYPDAADAKVGAELAWQIAAVLTSPLASAWAWHRSAGTGLSADAIRVGPVMLAELPWPAGDLDGAVSALREHDVRRCAAEVHAAFGVMEDALLNNWWGAALIRIEARQPTNVTARSLPE